MFRNLFRSTTFKLAAIICVSLLLLFGVLFMNLRTPYQYNNVLYKLENTFNDCIVCDVPSKTPNLSMLSVSSSAGNNTLAEYGFSSLEVRIYDDSKSAENYITYIKNYYRSGVTKINSDTIYIESSNSHEAFYITNNVVIHAFLDVSEAFRSVSATTATTETSANLDSMRSWDSFETQENFNDFIRHDIRRVL